MILTKEVQIKWTRNNKSYYEERGYEFTKYNDEFTVLIEDLLPNSTASVLVKCDYCQKEKEKTYSLYNTSVNRGPVKKYACKSCSIHKQRESNKIKYGTEDALGYFEEIRQKKKDFRQRYYKEKKG